MKNSEINKMNEKLEKNVNCALNENEINFILNEAADWINGAISFNNISKFKNDLNVNYLNKIKDIYTKKKILVEQELILKEIKNDEEVVVKKKVKKI